MLKNIIKNNKTLVASFLAVVLFALLPMLINNPYYLNLFINVMVSAVISMCFLMMLRTGLISLGIAAFWGIGAYMSATLTMKFGMSFWTSLPLSGIITGLMALIIGFILIGSGSGGFSFVMLSAVIGMLFTVAIGNISYLGGYAGIAGIPSPEPLDLPLLAAIEFTSSVHFFYLALILFVIIIIIIKSFYSDWTGKAWTAIGLNPNLAESIGINIFRFKLLNFVVTSTICGLMGSFYAHYQHYIVPDTFGMAVNINVQLYAILGGANYPVLGPIIGATVMTFLPEFLRVMSVVAPIIEGVLMVLLIMFLPQGILGLVNYQAAVSTQISSFFRNNKTNGNEMVSQTSQGADEL